MREQQVALGPVPPDRTLAANAQLAAVRRTGRDPDRDGQAVEGRNLDLGAQRGLGEAHRDVQRQVLALPAEDPVRLDVHGDVEVARGATPFAGRALALQPDPLTVLHARRDADLHGLARLAAAGAVAGLARLVDDQTATLALGARLGHREHATLDRGLHARAFALQADLRHSAVLRTGAATRLAGLVAGHPEPDGDTVHGLGELDRRLGLDVRHRAAAGPSMVVVVRPPPPPNMPPRMSPSPPPPPLWPPRLNRSPTSKSKPPPTLTAAARHPEAAAAEQPARLVVLLALLRRRRRRRTPRRPP